MGILYDIIMKHSDLLLNTIERYIAKSDEDLKKRLKREGFVNTSATISMINELEDKYERVLSGQTDKIIDILKQAEAKGWGMDKVKELVEDFINKDDISLAIQEATVSAYDEGVHSVVTGYTKKTESDVKVNRVRQRTTNWFMNWAEKLGGSVNKTSHNELQKLVEQAVENGDSVAETSRKILEGGFRDNYAKSRQIAQTEMLRIHSFAANEAIQQSPVVSKKEWKHTGSYKNNPRQNHIDMDGQIVPKDKPFVMTGRDGGTYYPMFPRDPDLPAAESINCHCICRGVVDWEKSELSSEERMKLRTSGIDKDDEEFMHLETKNKRKAGINESTVILDSMRNRTKKEQIKYCRTKNRWALVESGVINDDKGLKTIRSKTLKELADNGIVTVDAKVLEHSVNGDIKVSKQYPKGRLVAGGHTQAAMELCDQKEIDYSITGEFSNGVRIGNVPSSKLKIKRTGNGQAWFPKDWDDDKVLVAGTAVANNGDELIEGYHKTGVYDGVAVRVLVDGGNISTICPDLNQEAYIEGVEFIENN